MRKRQLSARDRIARINSALVRLQGYIARASRGMAPYHTDEGRRQTSRQEQRLKRRARLINHRLDLLKIQ